MDANNRQVIYLASGNAHKVAEMGALAERDGLGVEIRSAKALGGMPPVEALADASGLPVRIHSAREIGGMPPVSEDSGTFVGNARKKARALWERRPEAASSWRMTAESAWIISVADREWRARISPGRRGTRRPTFAS